MTASPPVRGIGRSVRRGPAARALTAALATLAADEQKNTYAKWFVLAIVVLLALLAVQMVVAVRRDRRRAAERDAEPGPGAPDHVEGEPAQDVDQGYGVDALGDVDDLQVHDHTAVTPGPAVDDTGEIAIVGDDYELYDEGDEPDSRRADG